MFSLNELVFAVATPDILFHMNKEEIKRSPAIENSQARLSAHLLTQRSFYPLFPPPDREKLPVGLKGVGAGLDVPHHRLADLIVTPDVLIVPSMLGMFAKVVEGVVVVNPGFASKPIGAGTWAEMRVKAMVPEEEGDVGHAVWERARVEVKRI